MFDLSKAQKVYIAVGYSDFRRGIDGFAKIINPYINQQQLQLEHFILEQILFCSFFLLLLFILSCIIVITHWGGDQFG